MPSKDTKILVVDSATSAEVRSHLRQIGFGKIDVTDNGASAIAMLRLKHHDVVLSEWDCRDMDAAQLLGFIRQDTKLRHAKFAVLTGNRQPASIGAAKQAGANSYILKPYTLAILKQKLDALVG